jgi:hypothetical protein
MRDDGPRIEPSAAAIGFLFVLAANARYLTGLTQVLDPMIAMDPYYIQMARRPVAEIVRTDPSWGPLYALWLKPFVAVLGDPLRVYFANVGALSVAVSVAIYAYLLRLTRRAAVAAGGSLCFLISVWNVPLDSKVSSFAPLVVVGGLAAAEAVPAGARRMSVAGLAVLVASYARPELYPAALIFAAAALWLSYREARAGDRGASWWSIAVALAILAPSVWTGTPASGRHDGIDRLLQALQEHFAWNWNRWHDAHASALSIWRQEFGAADTPLTAALANPRAVARHVADNTVGTLRLIVGSAFDHFPLFAPPTWPRAVAAENVFVTAAALGVVVATIARPERRRALRDRYGTALFQYAVLTAVCAVATAIIFPVPRYVTMPCVLVLLTAALATSVLLPTSRRFGAGTRVAIALVCLAAVPQPFVVPSTYAVAGLPFAGRITVSRRVADTVAFVRALQLPLPVRVLSTTDGIGALLGDGFDQVDVWAMGTQPLEAYVRAHDVGLVINLEGGRQSLAVDDPTWARLQLQPEELGFTGVPVPGHEIVRVLVRNDLVARAGARH